MKTTTVPKLSTRFILFITLIVCTVTSILFVSGVLTVKKLGDNYSVNYLERVNTIIDKGFSSVDNVEAMQAWLPKLLFANNVIRFEIKNTETQKSIYNYIDSSYELSLRDDISYQHNFELKNHAKFTVHYQLLPPYSNSSYSPEAFAALFIAFLLVVFCLFRSITWMKRQLRGAELLEDRGHQLLSGNVDLYTTGSKGEWPHSASVALDRLIVELKYAREERNRFDTFIRTNTFIDSLTGAANRLLLNSKLESELQERGANGIVLIIAMSDWDELTDVMDSNESDQLIISIGHVLTQLYQRFTQFTFSRYCESEFALLLPLQPGVDFDLLLKQTTNYLDKIELPPQVNESDWYHIGATSYQYGENCTHILDEAYLALNNAKRQHNNSWVQHQKSHQVSREQLGSVKWRSLLDSIIKNSDMVFYKQACYSINNYITSVDYFKLSFTIIDEKKEEMSAAQYTSAVEKVGYKEKLDKAMLLLAFPIMFQRLLHDTIHPSYNSGKTSNYESFDKYAIGLSVEPFSRKEYRTWFRFQMLQCTQNCRERLLFVFNEKELVANLDYMRPIINKLSASGCKIIVGEVGRTIVSTYYAKTLPISYLQLDKSLVKKIDKRAENQLFIRSILGACDGAPVRVIAEGVETKAEWSALNNLGVEGGQGPYLAPKVKLVSDDNQKQSGNKQSLPINKGVAPIKAGGRNRWRK